MKKTLAVYQITNINPNCNGRYFANAIVVENTYLYNVGEKIEISEKFDFEVEVGSTIRVEMDENDTVIFSLINDYHNISLFDKLIKLVQMHSAAIIDGALIHSMCVNEDRDEIWFKYYYDGKFEIEESWYSFHRKDNVGGMAISQNDEGEDFIMAYTRMFESPLKIYFLQKAKILSE